MRSRFLILGALWALSGAVGPRVAPPVEAAVQGAATAADLEESYEGGTYSLTNEARQGAFLGMEVHTVDGTSFEATGKYTLPALSGVEAFIPLPDDGPITGKVTAKGKFTATGEFEDGLKLKLKGTLTAGGDAILGTYTLAQGKTKLDAGTFILDTQFIFGKGPGAQGAGQAGDLFGGYVGNVWSHADAGRQSVDLSMLVTEVDGESFEAGVFIASLPALPFGSVRPSAKPNFAATGKVAAKGKTTFSGEIPFKGIPPLKFAFKGTLSAGGQSIIGTYSIKQGKSTLETGSFALFVAEE
jgi:hypothetical protein